MSKNISPYPVARYTPPNQTRAAPPIKPTLKVKRFRLPFLPGAALRAVASEKTAAPAGYAYGDFAISDLIFIVFTLLCGKCD